MKRKVKICVSILITIVLIVSGMLTLTNIVQRKSSDFKYNPFFAEEKDFDVLFLGTSHVINAVFPMELWNDYGITSYNFGGHGNEIATTYWTLINALDYTSPQLVVVDCLKLSSEAKAFKNNNYVHYSLDAFPLTLNKIKAIFDLMEKGKRLEFLCDFSIYHTRWNELTESDFIPTSNKEKGAEYRPAVGIPNEIPTVNNNEKCPSNTIAATYLRKIIEACKERGIDVLLTYLPFPASEEEQKEAHLVYDIANEYGVNYINFLDMPDCINYATDCYDEDSHLNPSGARKVTDYLGKYITAHYGLGNKNADETYSSWNTSYREYIDTKFYHLKTQKALDTTLMLLSDKNISSCVFIKGESNLLQDDLVVKLLQNISPSVNLTKLSSAISSGEDYLLVTDQENVLESIGYDNLSNLATSFGDINYINDPDSSKTLSINKTEDNYLTKLESGQYADVYIVAVDNQTGETRYTASFQTAGSDENNHLTARKN